MPSGRTQRRTKRVVTDNQVQLTQNEQRQLTECLKPAHEDVINANLVRLYFEKRLTGDKNQQAYTLRDYVRRLKGITELEVFEMAEHFIENHDSDFAPKFSSMKAWLRDNNIDLNKRC